MWGGISSRESSEFTEAEDVPQRRRQHVRCRYARHRQRPLQKKAQFEKVKGYLDDAKPDGIIVAGGAALQRKAYFIAPTIVRHIPDTSRLVVEADSLLRFWRPVR
jgi:hypothetical protein